MKILDRLWDLREKFHKKHGIYPKYAIMNGETCRRLDIEMDGVPRRVNEERKEILVFGMIVRILTTYLCVGIVEWEEKEENKDVKS